jgi:hypothetical protein
MSYLVLSYEAKTIENEQGETNTGEERKVNTKVV